MPTLPEILTAFEMDRTEFDNLRRRDHFNTRFAGDVRFEPTRQNALEIGFMGALRCVGYKPSVAQAEVKLWLQQQQAGKLCAMWAANPRRPEQDGLGVGYDDRSIGFEDMAKAAPDDEEDTGYQDTKFERHAAAKRAIQIVFIDRAEIVRRVDALFSVAK